MVVERRYYSLRMGFFIFYFLLIECFWMHACENILP